MFREMAGKENKLTEEETMRIIASQDYGILCVHGDDGFPYGVPVNYAYHDGKIYIHGATENSHRMDGIQKDNKVCFTIVGKHDLIKEDYRTEYSSVIVFGTASVLQGKEEKEKAMLAFMQKLAPIALEKVRDTCVKDVTGYSIVEITPMHVTGKASF